MIKRLSNRSLARLLLRKVWQRYDAGGISCHRALQASLLEGFVDLISPPRIDILDKWEIDDLYEEALQRPECRSKREIPTTKLVTLDIAYRSLAGLKLWYIWDEKKEDPEVYSPWWGKRYVFVACALLELPSLGSETTFEDLVRFANEARRKLSDNLRRKKPFVC